MNYFPNSLGRFTGFFESFFDFSASISKFEPFSALFDLYFCEFYHFLDFPDHAVDMFELSWSFWSKFLEAYQYTIRKKTYCSPNCNSLGVNCNWLLSTGPFSSLLKIMDIADLCSALQMIRQVSGLVERNRNSQDLGHKKMVYASKPQILTGTP